MIAPVGIARLSSITSFLNPCRVKGNPAGSLRESSFCTQLLIIVRDHSLTGRFLLSMLALPKMAVEGEVRLVVL